MLVLLLFDTIIIQLKKPSKHWDFTRLSRQSVQIWSNRICSLQQVWNKNTMLWAMQNSALLQHIQILYMGVKAYSYHWTSALKCSLSLTTTFCNLQEQVTRIYEPWMSPPFAFPLSIKRFIGPIWANHRPICPTEVDPQKYPLENVLQGGHEKSSVSSFLQKK
jgi:hypothetical protein